MKTETMINSITIEQVKAARALLKWTAANLASKANVGAATVRRYESGQGVRDAAKNAIFKAIQTAGVVFIPENGGGAGVRLAKNG